MSHNQKMFILAILVVICFVFSAIMISYRAYLWMLLFFVGGLGLMGLGLNLKRKYQNRDE